MSPSTVADETFVVERMYPVRVEHVFRAWSDPARKARWFAGSVEALGDGYELDFRVGGSEENRGGPPDGPVYTYAARFHDIVANQRIVSTYEMYAGDIRISVSVATVEFRGTDGETHLILTEQGAFLDGHDTVTQREEGTRALLESLATTLVEESANGRSS